MKQLKINSEEKTVQFFNILILWISFGILFIYVCFHDYNKTHIRGVNILMEEIEEINTAQYEQSINIKHVDSLSRLLALYNPENKQSYLESSIVFELNELKKTYEKKQKDPSFSIYMKINNLYSMMYYDKKASWNTINNTNYLKKNLGDCEIGFQQNQNNITLQEVLENSAIKE